jgi:phosphatidylglycerol:prolipoprotein diacylglycerol transferase
VAALVIVHRHQLPLAAVAGAAAVPLTIAYGIGRLGCLLAGDGTYGKPTSVPWAMAFPNGVVPTTVPVHPTPLYEALAAVLIAAILWALARSWNLAAVFGAYLALSGISRFLVEFLRINEPALLGLTQPQLWALVSLIAGVVLIVRTQYINRPPRIAAEAPGTGEAVTARSDDAVTARSTT